MSIFKIKKYINGIDYDKNTDYTEKINEAKAAGDTSKLAELEEARNRKIEGENLNERKTYNYIDIGTKIEEGIRNNISAAEMKELVDARRDKAYQNKQYDIYKNDEIQKKGLKYYYDAESGAGVNHSNRPEEERSYDEQISSLLEKISNVQNFSYNPEDDPAYTALKSQMRNESRRAATDVLAEVGQQGGGTSSYAVSAAAQAANNYNAKLTEEIPRLAELAYQRYADSVEGDRKALDYALKASDKEHEEYIDSLEQFNDDREYARESYENALDRYAEEEDREFEKKMELDELEYKKEEDSRDRAWDAVLNYEKNGVAATDELLSAAGMGSYGALNKESASIYRNKLDLDALVKNKQIANYDARTAKTYNDISLANAKFAYQKQKDADKKTNNKTQIKSAEDVFKVNMTNGRNENGVLIGEERVNLTKFVSGCISGSIVETKNADGSYSYKYAEKKK